MSLNTLPGVHEMQTASIDDSKLCVLEDSASKEDFLLWKSNMIDLFRQDADMDEIIENVENTVLATNEDLEGIDAMKAHPLEKNAEKRNASRMKNASHRVYGWLTEVLGRSLFRITPNIQRGDGGALWLAIMGAFQDRDPIGLSLKSRQKVQNQKPGPIHQWSDPFSDEERNWSHRETTEAAIQWSDPFSAEKWSFGVIHHHEALPTKMVEENLHADDSNTFFIATPNIQVRESVPEAMRQSVLEIDETSNITCPEISGGEIVDSIVRNNCTMGERASNSARSEDWERSSSNHPNHLKAELRSILAFTRIRSGSFSVHSWHEAVKYASWVHNRPDMVHQLEAPNEQKNLQFDVSDAVISIPTCLEIGGHSVSKFVGPIKVHPPETRHSKIVCREFPWRETVDCITRNKYTLEVGEKLVGSKDSENWIRFFHRTQEANLEAAFKFIRGRSGHLSIASCHDAWKYAYQINNNTDPVLDATMNVFNINKLGELKWLLGRAHKLKDLNLNATPADPRVSFHNFVSEQMGTEANNMGEFPYKDLIRSFLFAASIARIDIAVVVGFFARFVNKPRKVHWTTAKRVLAYLKSTIDKGIIFRATPMLFEGYTDSNCGGDKKPKSTSRACFSLNGGAVSWLSKRQIPTAISSAEAEYYAASLAVQEAKWLRALLSELGVAVSGPTNIAEDNNACILMAKNPVNHFRCKHIPMRYLFTRQAVEGGEVVLFPVASNDNIADFLTKALPRGQFQKFRDFAMGATR